MLVGFEVVGISNAEELIELSHVNISVLVLVFIEFFLVETYMDSRFLMIEFRLGAVPIATVIQVALFLLLCFFIIVDNLKLDLWLWPVHLLLLPMLFKLLERVVPMQPTSINFHATSLHSILLFFHR